MITNLKIKNFKSIGDDGVKVDLRPLTIFLGPNGSGKSSILEAIGVLCQSTEGSSFQPKGRLVNIPAASNVFYKNKIDNWLSFEVHIRATDAEIKKLIKISSDKLSDDLLIAIQQGDIGYKFSHKLKTNEFIQTVMVEKHRIAKSSLIKVNENAWTYKLEFPKKISTPDESADRIFNEKVFTPREKPEEYYPFSDLAKEIAKIIKERILNHVFLISAIRGRTEFEKVLDSSINEKSLKVLGVGTYGEHLIPVLSLVHSNRKYEKIYEKISEWASKFGLSKLSAGWKGGDTLGSDYVDESLDAILNLAQASHGSKQILSVITQLFWSDPGSIIMIEEPEISLHPNSQALLAELFAEAVLEGKQIIITTHSEFLPLTLSIPIQKKLLNIRDIAVYHVEKEEKGSTIKRLEMTSKGYVKNWIPSFAELEAQLLKDWMETVPEV